MEFVYKNAMLGPKLNTSYISKLGLLYCKIAPPLMKSGRKNSYNHHVSIKIFNDNYYP